MYFIHFFFFQIEADVTGTPLDLEVQLPITVATIPLNNYNYAAPATPGAVITEQPSGM